MSKWSVPSRRRLPSREVWICSAVARAPSRIQTTFVASTTSSRRPAIALPTISSVPYASDVSRTLIPISSAVWTTAIDSSSVRPALRPNRLGPPQPSPATLTSSPVRPSAVNSISALCAAASLPR